MTEQALPLARAAAALGTTPEALRMRMRRGRLKGYKGEDGRLYVVVDLDAAQAAPTHRSNGPSSDLTTPEPGPTRLVTALESEVADLRRRLDEAERAQSELRRLLLLSQQSITQLSRRVGELPAPERDNASESPPIEHPAPARAEPPSPPPAPEPDPPVAPPPPRPMIWPWSMWMWPTPRAS